jgi:hypothetical protein
MKICFTILILFFFNFNVYSQNIKLCEYSLTFNQFHDIEYIDLIFSAILNENKRFDLLLTKKELELYQYNGFLPNFKGLDLGLEKWYIVTSNNDTLKSYQFAVAVHSFEKYKKLKLRKKKNDLIKYHHRLIIPKEIVSLATNSDEVFKLLIFLKEFNDNDETSSDIKGPTYQINFRCKN